MFVELVNTMEAILYVDDDPDDRELFCSALLQLHGDKTCSEAESAEECIRLLNEATVLPRVIVTDINMPVMDGLELLRYLKSEVRFNHIPVILFSTANSPNAKQFFKLGAHSYFIKPQLFSDYDKIIKTIFNEILGDDVN